MCFSGHRTVALERSYDVIRFRLKGLRLFVRVYYLNCLTILPVHERRDDLFQKLCYI